MKLLKQSLRRIFHWSNSMLYRDSQDFPFDMDRGFQRIFNRTKPYTMTTLERMYAMYKATEHVSRNSVKGAIVECGVWRGGSIMISALTFKKFQDMSRTFYLYDTFAGMSKPGNVDTTRYDGAKALDMWKFHHVNGKVAWCDASLEDVRRNVYATGYPKNKFVFVEGKVENTIPHTVPERIALLRLDTDWYNSTYHELVHLFPKLSPGGVLIIDDYGHWEGCRRAVDQYFRENNVPMLLHRIDYGGRVGMKMRG